MPTLFKNNIDNQEDFTRWLSGECPVPSDTKVEVILRNPDRKFPPMAADFFR